MEFLLQRERIEEAIKGVPEGQKRVLVAALDEIEGVTAETHQLQKPKLVVVSEGGEGDGETPENKKKSCSLFAFLAFKESRELVAALLGKFFWENVPVDPSPDLINQVMSEEAILLPSADFGTQKMVVFNERVAFYSGGLNAEEKRNIEQFPYQHLGGVVYSRNISYGSARTFLYEV